MSDIEATAHHDPLLVGDPAGVSAGQALRALAFVAGYALVAVGVAFGAHAVGLVDLRSAAAVVAVLAAATVASFAAVYVHLIRAYRLGPAQLGFARPAWRLLHLLWQLPVLVICAAGAQALVLFRMTGSSTREQSAGGAFADLGQLPVGLAVAAVVLGAVLTPVWEEAMFRGALLTGLARRLGVPLGILLSAVVFAGFHLAPVVMPYVFVLGLGLGYLRWFHRNLWASVAAHAVNNGLSLLAVLLATAT